MGEEYKGMHTTFTIQKTSVTKQKEGRREKEILMCIYTFVCRFFCVFQVQRKEEAPLLPRESA